ncbi:hypothetical protein [Saccharothrix algeriensis]|uniref:DUF3558 domain-containing protein n=1 Tax=Saccharothrix algeriensis TaxID=173560 RepID=A0ABS2SBL9_9PSEU|nr:hypothetical protein [Saccharothrix algeriensis]MBM7812471.1 hypothetical protein [Saccharothrix algeriensis]
MQLTRDLATRSILLILVAGLVLTGCTTTDPGNATAGRDSTFTTETSEGTTTTSAPAGGGDELAKFDACAELNAVAGQFALSRIEKVGAKGCQARWGQTTTAVTIVAVPELPIGEATGGPDARYSDVMIGARKAKRVEAGLTDVSCLVAVEVTAESRVDFYGAATTSVDESCAAATKLAEAVEPKLPK